MAGQLTIDTLKASSGVLATQNGMTGIAKAWVSFNGVTGSIYGTAFNVGSITKTTTGQYVVNMTTAMPNSNYGVIASTSVSLSPLCSENININAGSAWSVIAPTTSSFAIATARYNGGAQDDTTYITAVVFSS